MIMEDTREEVLAATGGALSHRQGRLSDDGEPRRPWLFITVGTREEAEEIRRALQNKGFVKERRDQKGWRYGAYGNDALIVLHDLLPYMEGVTKAYAELLLGRWGDGGKPWHTEYERIRETLRNADN